MWGLNFETGSTRVAVVLFSDEASIQFPLNEYTRREEVLNAIAFKNDMKRTGTAAGLRALRQDVFSNANGDRTGFDNYAIVITDGRSNIDSDLTPQEAASLQAVAEVFAVGVGHNGQVDRNEINDIASDTDSDHAYFMEREEELDLVANNILDVICQ